MKQLKGTGVALVTPFKKNLQVDFDAFEKLINHVSQKKGVDYMVLLGTTGESATLTKDEKKQLIKFLVAKNKSRLPLVIGIGGNNTQEILANFKEYDLKGFDAILSVTPYYNKPTQEGLYQHYVTLAKHAPLPIILYNVPGRTAVNMTAETTLRLAKVKNIIAIKEASGNLEQCLRIAANKPKDFMLLSGEDILTPSMIAFGAEGVISVLANAFPVQFSEMIRFSMQNKFEKAAEILYKFDKINPLMYTEGNPAGVKSALAQMKIGSPYVRQPLVPATKELEKKIKDAMKAL